MSIERWVISNGGMTVEQTSGPDLADDVKLEVLPVSDYEVVEAEVKKRVTELAECHRLSGAEPSGVERMDADEAVQEVRRLREESDSEEERLHVEFADASVQLARLRESLEELQRGPDTLTQDGLRIVLRALNPEAAEENSDGD